MVSHVIPLFGRRFLRFLVSLAAKLVKIKVFSTQFLRVFRVGKRERRNIAYLSGDIPVALEFSFAHSIQLREREGAGIDADLAAPFPNYSPNAAELSSVVAFDASSTSRFQSIEFRLST